MGARELQQGTRLPPDHEHDARYPRYDAAHALTAAEQAQARANLDAAGAFSGSRIVDTVGQAIPTNTVTQLAFDHEAYDTDAYATAAPEFDGFDIPEAGHYRVLFQVAISNQAVGQLIAMVFVNGAKRAQVNYADTAGDDSAQASFEGLLAAGDVVTFRTLHNGSASYSTDTDHTWATIQRLDP